MLVLSRKIGEAIVIGDDIEVTVTRMAGNRVTLGITAPSAVRVLRGELAEEENALPAEPERHSERMRLVAR